MRRIAFAAAFVLSAFAAPPAPAAERKIEIFDDDTVVVYGDSITEQNLYAAYIETFLLTRFPERNVRVYNFGWGGDTADGGNRRFARDVLPVRPTLVFVNFGMNDGRYTVFTQATHDWYMGSQRALAETIKAAGAKEVLLTTSPVHPWDWNYNDTLGRMADDVLGLAKELGLGSADIFHPMYGDLKKIAEKRPGHSVIPDRVHPNPAGHLLMAYYVLREIDAPGLVGEIEIDRDRGAVARSEGARVANLRKDAGVISFDLTLPFIPFYVPPEARESLEYVPLQKELNRFTFAVKGWGTRPCMLVVDGQEAGSVRAEDLAKGADLALLDGAAWTVQGRQVWELAQFRWRKHFEAWRPMGLQAPGYAREIPSYDALIEAQKAYVADLGAAMRRLARPRTYGVRLTVSSEVAIPAVELSPLYKWDKAEFEKSFPPETEPDKVEWRKVALDAGGFVDFTRVFQGPENCAVYARVEVEASADCTLRLALGSDDGLKVFANGRRILAKDVHRGYRAGEDQVEAALKRGRNTLLFEITQGSGGFGFGVKARVEGDAVVEVVRPAP